MKGNGWQVYRDSLQDALFKAETSGSNLYLSVLDGNLMGFVGERGMI